MLGIPAVVGLSLLGRQILRIFSTAEFADSGYLVIPFVAVSMLLSHFYAVRGQEVLKLAKKTNILAVVWVVMAILNLGLNIIFVPHFGILAAAATTLFTHALGIGITLYYSTRELSFQFDWLFILKSLIASGVMAAVIVIITPEKSWQVFSVIVLGVLVYGIALLAMKGFNRNEIRFFTGLFKRRTGSS